MNTHIVGFVIILLIIASLTWAFISAAKIDTIDTTPKSKTPKEEPPTDKASSNPL